MIAAGGCCFLLPAALSGWRLLLLLRPAALGGWRLLLLLRPAALNGCLLPPLLRLSARGGLQLLLLLRPAALTPWLLFMGSPALHPRLRLVSQCLFLILLLLMLLQLFATGWYLTGGRWALAHDGHRRRRFATLPTLVGGGVHFTFIVF